MNVLTIVFAILAVFGYFLSYFFSVKARIYSATEDAVNNAEQEDKESTEKLEFAVNQIYELVPTVAKPFFTKNLIRKIVQKAFDKIEAYAQKQLKRKDDESENLSSGN